MTLAEQWRDKIAKQSTFESIAEYMNALLSHDPDGEVTRTDLGVVIQFTDGSQHRMGA